jgi:hypothetical protein
MKKLAIQSFQYRIPKDRMVEEWRELWGVPNWEDFSAYPKNLSNEQIKWEFVRRNSDYRLIWESYQEELDNNRHLSQENFENNVINTFSSAVEYGLENLINPQKQAKELRGKIFTAQYRGTKVTSHSDGTLMTGTWGRNIKNIMHENNAILVFDLKHPIPIQIKNAQTILKLEQRKIKSTKNIEVTTRGGVTKEYSKHLRLLDAYFERVSLTKIGVIVFKIEDKKDAQNRARYELKRAIQMWRYL